MAGVVRGVCCVGVATLFLLAPSGAFAQDSKSAAMVGELTKLLDSRKLDSIAAKSGNDQFVGALYFAGSQLLVVSARYSVPQSHCTAISPFLKRRITRTPSSRKRTISRHQTKVG